jgi:hypothetical protein
MSEVPTPAGFLVDERSIFQRWKIAKKNNYVIETGGKKIGLCVFPRRRCGSAIEAD